jgi:hypothetical protein
MVGTTEDAICVPPPVSRTKGIGHLIKITLLGLEEFTGLNIIKSGEACIGRKHIAESDDIIAMAKAWDKAAIKHFGIEFIKDKLNFPNDE